MKKINKNKKTLEESEAMEVMEQEDPQLDNLSKKKKKKKKKNQEKKEVDANEPMIEFEPEEKEAIKDTEQQESDHGEESQKKKKKKKKNKRKIDEEEEEMDSDSTSIKKTKLSREDGDEIFKKCFYDGKGDSKLSSSEIKDYFKKHSIHVYGQGSESIVPVLSFDDMSSLGKKCLKCCKSFKAPTPIQSMTWPVVASGRDVIGIAETGSGKTLAFSVPALAHISERKQRPVKGVNSMPIMLIVAPTRESLQCSLKSFWRVLEKKSGKALSLGVEILVATPGRLLDLAEEGCVDLSGVSYVVLDEADRMLDQGFEQDIRRILGQTHKERQTCLFSATWPDSIRKLAHEFLKSPIKVTIGSEDLAAGKTVTQIVEVVDERSRDGKRIDSGTHSNMSGTALLFMGITTDVAARGLDIPDVEYVLNYSFPLTIEDYVHRIGRTGRAGKSGIAHTFFHLGDKARAGELVNVLKESNQDVPPEMYKFDLSVKRKEHKLYGSFGPKDYDEELANKKATRIRKVHNVLSSIHPRHTFNPLIQSRIMSKTSNSAPNSARQINGHRNARRKVPLISFF
ncbi:DBP3 [Lepeophtheirus salmonis]|uniref:RNA helicase n=1 Tax=Lepeophtheirus salmonis TaxID=72036 RepID=A0A7R8CI48_LEPSM|nr:DBP3 [Lepeophtheirus salmonis]CAF2829213.1 DBP3 [Lepeophtheirus salmonis]